MDREAVRDLTFSADYLRPSLRCVEVENVAELWGRLSPQLMGDITYLNDLYQEIIPMDLQERGNVLRIIRDLDVRGIELSKRIGAELGASKTRYYSEGMWKLL